MSQQALNDLLAQGGGALAAPLPAEELQYVPEPLRPLISKRNGFYAFGPALYVRPWGAGYQGNCLWWNAKDLWRQEYKGVGDDLLFFAEDLFGFQFGLARSGFYSFDPETTEREFMAKDVFGWAQKILSDADNLTGAPLGDAWIEQNGPLPLGTRLAPVVPFFLGGEFEVDHLNPIPEVELMRFRGDVFQQTKDLPDGAQVDLGF
ncbi:hypothetical protein O1R50_18490 [Glycomyces luteolus]|uniref:SMI1/KNR4 family protein n=1 Tax=Glycomyces luteolus TaxID=2670330 RepID=A0A9X3PA47_9ACTN|nr:hypothetical protein [Glycomyces luteolus]MDA1361623.1 hypothetical protein [Glycomyces luteolus]